MKVLVTGANGVVGKLLTKQLKDEGFEVLATDKDILDITDVDYVRTFLADSKPQMLIHLAAATDVDWCETHPEECYQINTKAVEDLAKLSKELGIIFVFPSTTFVFSGEEGRVYDDRVDKPSVDKVLGVYSKSKLLSEQAIEKIGGEYFVIRFGQLFFGGQSESKFVGTVLSQAREGQEIRAVDDRRVQPTYLPDLMKNVVELIKTKHWGVYNMVGRGQASYYEFAKEVVELLKSNSKVTAIASLEFKEASPRPKNLECINGKLQDLSLDLMRDWKEALREYLT